MDTVNGGLRTVSKAFFPSPMFASLDFCPSLSHCPSDSTRDRIFIATLTLDGMADKDLEGS